MIEAYKHAKRQSCTKPDSGGGIINSDAYFSFFFVVFWILELFHMIAINDFWGDLADASAVTQTSIAIPANVIHHCQPLRFN